jgi:hypothetical protein
MIGRLHALWFRHRLWSRTGSVCARSLVGSRRPPGLAMRTAGSEGARGRPTSAGTGVRLSRPTASFRSCSQIHNRYSGVGQLCREGADLTSIRAAAQHVALQHGVAPSAQSGNRADAAQQLVLALQHHAGLVGDDLADQCLLGREMMVKLGLAGAAGDPDLVEGGGGDTLDGHQLSGRQHDAFPGGRTACGQPGALAPDRRVDHGRQVTRPPGREKPARAASGKRCRTGFPFPATSPPTRQLTEETIP